MRGVEPDTEPALNSRVAESTDSHALGETKEGASLRADYDTLDVVGRVPTPTLDSLASGRAVLVDGELVTPPPDEPTEGHVGPHYGSDDVAAPIDLPRPTSERRRAGA